MTTQNRWDFEKIDTLVKVALGLGAVLVYGVVRVTVNAFYDKLGLTAETVGIGQAEILGRSALYLAFFAVVAVPTAFAASFVLSRFLPKSIRGDETIRMQWSTLLLLMLSFPAVLIFIPDFASFLRRGLSPASYEMALLPHLWRALPLSLVLFAATWLWITLLVLNRLWTAVDSKNSREEPGAESVGSTPRGWAKRINHALDAATSRVQGSRYLTIFALAWLPFMISF
jgi:hypothetical protein